MLAEMKIFPPEQDEEQEAWGDPTDPFLTLSYGVCSYYAFLL